MSDLIKCSEYSLNQFLSYVEWVNVHNTLHMPPKEKSRGVRSGDLGGHETGPPVPIHFSLQTLFSFVLIDDYTVLPQHRIGQGKGIATCFH